MYLLLPDSDAAVPVVLVGRRREGYLIWCWGGWGRWGEVEGVDGGALEEEGGQPGSELSSSTNIAMVIYQEHILNKI